MIENYKIDKYISSELRKFNFNTTSLGFKYIKYAIKIGIENENLLENFNNRLYIKMQNKLNINKKKIKWDIEKSINYMYLNTDANFLINYFSLNIEQKVTPKLFIITMVDNFFRN